MHMRVFVLAEGGVSVCLSVCHTFVRTQN